MPQLLVLGRYAEDRAHAEKAIEAFAKTYGTKWPKAVAKITDDADEMLAFYDFPAVRHEALLDRAEVGDLRRWAVAAA